MWRPPESALVTARDQQPQEQHVEAASNDINTDEARQQVRVARSEYDPPVVQKLNGTSMVLATITAPLGERR